MNQLETTIIESARYQLDELRRALARQDDTHRREDVTSAYWMLNGLMTLANIKDSGMSADAIRELQAIERESAQAMAEQAVDDESRLANVFLIVFFSMGIATLATALLFPDRSWLVGAAGLCGLIGLGGFFLSRHKNKPANA